MCIGVPMQVIEARVGSAVCEANGERRAVDMMLTGDQPQGTWVLVFLDTAREVVTAEQAETIGNALAAVDLALGGAERGDIDRLFADLTDREPQLPAFLRPATD